MRWSMSDMQPAQLPHAETAEDGEADDQAAVQPRVPGTQRLWIRTFGCSHNISDSEYMAGMLQQVGMHWLDTLASRTNVSAANRGTVSRSWPPELSAACRLTMLSRLLQYGFTLLPDEQREAADLWLVNTCTVKSPSQSAMDNVISAGWQLGKHLVVAGCVPQGES